MNERTFMQGYTNFHRKLARSQRVIDSYMLLLLIVSIKTERQTDSRTDTETERDRTQNSELYYQKTDI